MRCRHAETRKRVDIHKSASVSCARTLRVQDGLFVTQAGTQRHEKGLTFITVRAWLAGARAKRTRQAVCDPGRDTKMV